ncbi:ABC transporter ATP-binding protein [uncultured Subdoligranulum sp.]|uniref:ABC transporter ATP-binding protein n=1 Tax=uncultured Subdoligranulum sp. TaxID=512298 RepID=UPI00320B6D72
MPNEAAVLHRVQKQYKDFTLGPLDLTVPTGTIVGLVGENGAGKTTTLKIACGVNRPDDGEVTLLGGSPADKAVRARLGVVFEDAYFFGGLTAGRIGNSMAGIFGDRWDAGLFGSLLERFGLDARKKVSAYSRGMRMKLSLATALAHHPDLLVLDEATAGLDPVVRSEMLDLFLEFIQDEGHSILMSSHITSDLEQIADSIAYLHHGQLLFQEDKDALLQEYGLLRCGRAALEKLPSGCVIFTRQNAFGCESLIRDRLTVQRLLPEAVIDPAGIDDIMRFYSGRDAQ